MNGKEWYSQVYLNSEEWQIMREEALRRAKNKCFVCRYPSSHNDVHHIVYDKSLASTPPISLMVLCRMCHDLMHHDTGLQNYAKATLQRNDIDFSRKKQYIKAKARKVLMNWKRHRLDRMLHRNKRKKKGVGNEI